VTVADGIQLLQQHDPAMRVLVADSNSIFGLQLDDLQVVEFSCKPALLITPSILFESWGSVY